jgi:hypothetical protein
MLEYQDKTMPGLLLVLIHRSQLNTLKQWDIVFTYSVACLYKVYLRRLSEQDHCLTLRNKEKPNTADNTGACFFFQLPNSHVR